VHLTSCLHTAGLCLAPLALICVRRLTGSVVQRRLAPDFDSSATTRGNPRGHLHLLASGAIAVGSSSPSRWRHVPPPCRKLLRRTNAAEKILWHTGTSPCTNRSCCLRPTGLRLVDLVHPPGVMPPGQSCWTEPWPRAPDEDTSDFLAAVATRHFAIGCACRRLHAPTDNLASAGLVTVRSCTTTPLDGYGTLWVPPFSDGQSPAGCQPASFLKLPRLRAVRWLVSPAPRTSTRATIRRLRIPQNPDDRSPRAPRQGGGIIHPCRGIHPAPGP